MKNKMDTSPKYGILTKIDRENLPNVSVKDAEYFFSGETIPMERGRKFIAEAKEKEPEENYEWKNVKIVWPTEDGVKYFWVRAHPIGKKLALTPGKSIDKAIMEHYREKAVNYLVEDNDSDEIREKVGKVFDASFRAMKDEVKKQFGEETEAYQFNDGEVTDTTIDDILGKIERDMDTEEDE